MSDVFTARVGRFFNHGDLRVVLLAIVSERPRHTHEIVATLGQLVAGAYTPSPELVNPTLALLLELGHVTTTSAPGFYEITPIGTAFLGTNREAADRLLARMAAISRERVGAPAPRIVRAVDDLKLGLQARLARGPLTPREVKIIAAIIDAATEALEKV